MTNASPNVLYSSSNHVARVTVNRESKRNALSFDTLAELTEAFRRANTDPDVRVIVLTGAGDRAFCSGADLGGLRDGEAGAEEAHAGRGNLASLFTTMYQLGKPTIARVRGYALAGGFGLALACDYVIASYDSVFGAPEVNIGLWPYMISVPLLRSMPPKVALDLILTGRRVPAQEAATIGFVSRVVSPAQLDDEIDGLCAQLAARSPAAIRLGRPTFYRILDQSSAQALPELQAMLSIASSLPDAAEGVAAFHQKREPVWPD
jgi:enoyl-CoA hydratase/carnithine racemase